ncbi:MAG: hypothetical protein WHS87_11700 [Anaerolineales bacterium]
MHNTLREWIVEILKCHEPLLAIAMRQRAKFEGWLKFELAAVAEKHGAQSVEVETAFAERGKRSDLSFTFNGTRYDVEIKTANSSWRVAGVHNKHRPLPRNIARIVGDAQKLSRYSEHGIVAFVLFPIPPQDERWTKYLDRLASSLGISLSAQEHCCRLSVDLGHNRADLVVCSFEVQRSKSLSPRITAG